jgi:hypothetical protein
MVKIIIFLAICLTFEVQAAYPGTLRSDNLNGSISGTNILADTINSNKLDVATRALLGTGGGTAGTTNQTFWYSLTATDGSNSMVWSNGVLTLTGPAATNTMLGAYVTNLFADTFILNGTDILDLIGGTTNNYTNFVSLIAGANVTITTNSATSFTIASTGTNSGSTGTSSNYYVGAVVTLSNDTPATIYSFTLTTNQSCKVIGDVVGYSTNNLPLTWSTQWGCRNSNGIIYYNAAVTILEHTPDEDSGSILTNAVLTHTNSGQTIQVQLASVTNTTLNAQWAGKVQIVDMPTIAAAPSGDFNPSNAVDTIYLLNADALVFDNAYGTNVIHDGDDVYLWKDSVSTNDVAPKGVSNVPTYKTNTVNGHASVRWDSGIHAAQNLVTKTTNNLNWAQPQTVYLVAANRTPTNTYNGYLFDGAALGNRQLALTDKNNNGRLYANAGTQMNGAVVSTNFLFYAFVFNGNSSQIWTNGVMITNGAAGSAASIGDTLGSRYSVDGEQMEGDIAWFQRCGNAGTDITNMWTWASNRFNLQ